jgi:hypothetical protein
MGTEPDAAVTSTSMESEAPPAKKRRGYFIPGVIALIAMVVLGVIIGGGDLEHPAATTIYGPAIESQIANGIEDVRNTNSSVDVTCPAQEPVKQGLRFECTANGGGLTNRTVYVVETDGRGDTRWSLTPP